MTLNICPLWSNCATVLFGGGGVCVCAPRLSHHGRVNPRGCLLCAFRFYLIKLCSSHIMSIEIAQMAFQEMSPFV